MKRNIITFLSVFAFTFLFAQQQGYNLFDAQDVDANGWLWFNTQAKIDKYVGQANNEIGAYRTGEGAKIIQLVSTDYKVEVPDPNGFPGDVINVSLTSTADPDTLGISKDPVITVGEDGKEIKEYPNGGPGALSGAIMLQAAKSAALGGGILIKLPPIVSYELYLSCENRMLSNTKLTAKEENRFSEYEQVKGYAAPFSYLSSGPGHKEWNVTLEKNGVTGAAVKADATQYVLAQNKTTRTMYVHGIRVFTTSPTGINNVDGNAFNFYYNGSALVSNSENAEVTLMDLTGKVILIGKGSYIPANHLYAGVYVAKITEGSRIQTTKVVIK